MSQSDGEKRPTDHMTAPALKKLAHIRNVTLPPRRSYGSIWGRVRAKLQGQKCSSWSGSLYVCERAYMCVKSLQNKDLRYEHFVVMQLRTCFKCPRGTISWRQLSLPTIPDVWLWGTSNRTLLCCMCDLHFQEGKAEKFDCFSLGLARVTPLATLQT